MLPVSFFKSVAYLSICFLDDTPSLPKMLWLWYLRVPFWMRQISIISSADLPSRYKPNICFSVFVRVFKPSLNIS